MASGRQSFTVKGQPIVVNNTRKREVHCSVKTFLFLVFSFLWWEHTSPRRAYFLS